MKGRSKTVFNWSGGKDSVLALQTLLGDNRYEVVSLLTTISRETQASSIHSIPLGLLEKQAECLGIPLFTVSMDKDLKNYDARMQETVVHFKSQGVTHFAFGDIFLADVKDYRQSRLHPLGIEVVEPLWEKSPTEIMDEFFRSGIQSKIIVTRADKLDQSFIGKELNFHTVSLFPKGIDLCGENGEYHTFSYAGGIFKKEIGFSISQVGKVLYDIRLDTGQTQTFEYWQADLCLA